MLQDKKTYSFPWPFTDTEYRHRKCMTMIIGEIRARYPEIADESWKKFYISTTENGESVRGSLVKGETYYLCRIAVE